MKRARRSVTLPALLVASFVISLGIPLTPSSATTSSDITPGTAANFAIISGGVISLGALTTFTETTTSQVALTAAVSLTITEIAAYTTAGLHNFVQNSDTATTALTDARNLRIQLDSLTGTIRSAVLGNETITAGVYDAESGTALSIATPLILDGGGDYNSVFVFRTPAAFNVGANLEIRAINGAQASHIFWVIAGAITIGADTKIPGNFISPAAINIGARDTIYGSLFGTTAAAITIGESAKITSSAHSTLSSWNNIEKIYGDASFSLTPPSITELTPGTFSYSSETATVASVSGSALSIAGVGTTVITAIFTPTNNFLFYSETATMVLTVTKGSQVITWAPTTSLLTTATPVTPSTTASGLDSAVITYSVTNAGATGCLIDTATAVLSFTGAGSCVVQAEATATARYNSGILPITFLISIPTPPAPPPPPPAPPPPPPPIVEIVVTTPVVTPVVTPSASPKPIPTTVPVIEPIVEVIKIIKPIALPKKPLAKTVISQVPAKIIFPEIFTLIQISPIRKLSDSLLYSLHISLGNMAIGQVVTVTLKDISK